jgi:branched-chain amino acid transport system permease protein
VIGAYGWEIPGLKQLIYGIALWLVITLLPQGVWPPLARKLGVWK